MTSNNRPHNKHTPWKLESGGVWIGAYADLETALKIAKSLGKHYYIRNTNDEIVEQS